MDTVRLRAGGVAPATPHLPVELLEEVFVAWALIDEFGPWTASLVCLQWRHIVLRCPAAWSFLRVTCLPFVKDRAPEEDGENGPDHADENAQDDEDDAEDSNGQGSDQDGDGEDEDEDEEDEDEDEDEETHEEEEVASLLKSPHFLELWVQRSKNAPLSVFINAYMSAHLGPLRVVQVFSILRPHTQRIRQLTLETDDKEYAEKLLKAILDRVQGLRLDGLSVFVTPHPRLPRVLQAYAYQSFTGSLVLFVEQLKSLSVKKIACRGCLPPIRGDLEDNVYELGFGKLSILPATLIQLLANHRYLRVLKLHRLWHFPDTDEHANRIGLPLLHTFYVERVDTFYCGMLLSSLDMPNLLTLVVNNTNIVEDINSGNKTYETMAAFGQAFVDFVRRSSRITTLHITSSPLPDRYLLAALRNASHLTSLRLESTFVGTPALRGLTPVLPSKYSVVVRPPVPCPNLQLLAFIRCDLVDGEQLYHLIRARNHADSSTSCITHIHVEQCESITEAWISKFRHVKGVDMGVTYFPHMTCGLRLSQNRP